MAGGTVKFFNTNKGFGFIQPDDGSSDVFVNVSALERSGVYEFNEGDRVSFEVEEDRRSAKLTAVDLRVTGSGGGRRPAVLTRAPSQASALRELPHVHRAEPAAPAPARPKAAAAAPSSGST